MSKSSGKVRGLNPACHWEVGYAVAGCGYPVQLNSVNKYFGSFAMIYGRNDQSPGNPSYCIIIAR